LAGAGEFEAGGRRSDNLIHLQVNPLQWNDATQKYDFNNATWEAPLTQFIIDAAQRLP